MTLRLRLALVYSLIAFVLFLGVGGAGVFLFVRELEGQFDGRLADRAEYTSDLLFGSASVAPFSSTGGFLIVVTDQSGTEIYRSPALERELPGPLITPGRQTLESGLTVRAAVRPLQATGVDSGQIWVALDDSSLVAAQRSAWQLLLAALIAAPGLMLLVGWFIGRYFLRGLARAARVAERLDPNAESIPLPARQDEVYRLLEAINVLLGRINAQQQREKALLGQIVHELGAPLTVLRASLSRAATRTDDEEVRRAGLVADELSFTTQDLMQLARGQMDITLALHYLRATALRDRLDRLVPGVHYTGDWNTMVLCDPDRLVQALRNLLANARRAAGPQGAVELCLEEKGGVVRFHVLDTGAGLPEDLGDRIFEPFVSGSGSSGLGLSVSRQIASLHGGDLLGRNRPTGGAEFILSIPSVNVGDEDEEDDDFGDAEHEDGGESLARTR